MYKIQNVMSGNLSFDLEQGSITLRSGQAYDLEVACSRKWIQNNTFLQRLIRQVHVRLVHDSAAVIPAQPVRQAKVSATKPLVVQVVTKESHHVADKAAVATPTIIDLSYKADPTPVASAPVVVTPVVVVPVVEPKVEPKVEVKVEAKVEPKVEPTVAHKPKVEPKMEPHGKEFGSKLSKRFTIDDVKLSDDSGKKKKKSGFSSRTNDDE